jgi:hypothetical protein
MAGTEYADCDFSSIGNEYFLKHGFFSLPISVQFYTIPMFALCNSNLFTLGSSSIYLENKDAPSPLAGEGEGEGDHTRSTPTLILPYQGGGLYLAVFMARG